MSTHQPQSVSTSTPATPSPPDSTGARQDSDQDREADETGVQPGPSLQEAELEQLREVFENSVYPLFQYGLQLDREGRSAINVFVASMPEGLESEDLDAIANMITDHHSTPDAEDLAFVVTHLYRLEQEEARLMNDGEPVTTMEDQLEAQEQISDLREEWFGPELSEWLFSSSEDGQASTDQEHTDSQTRDGPSEELPDELVENQDELADMEDSWTKRYQQFESERQVIDRAGLDQDEKDKQIETLLRQHYTAQELEAARAFDQARQQTAPAD